MNNIRDKFIEMNKGIISEEYINIYCEKHKQFEMKLIMTIVV